MLPLYGNQRFADGLPLTSFEIALTGIGALLILLALRVPVAVAMIVVGVGGYVSLAGWAPLLNYAKTSAYWRFANYDLSVIPMFLLMSQFAARAGLSRALFKAANTYLGHRRGGVAMAAIGGCAGFGAICGSSLATAATMAPVALPELRRLHYSDALATGALAAGGTLGILIPPSVVLVIYAIAVEANIVTMFQAALLPGLLAALGYISPFRFTCAFAPKLARLARALIGRSAAAPSQKHGPSSLFLRLSSAASISAFSRRPKAQRLARLVRS